MWHEWIREWFSLKFDHVLITYIPNKDREGKEFDVEPWELDALELQGRLFHGATSYPSRGSYRSIDTKGNITAEVMVERTRMIVSFVGENDLTKKALAEISDFLKKFGAETNQESVAFVIDGEMFYIDISSKTKL